MASWALMAYYSLILFFMTFEYFSFRSDINFLLQKQSIVHYIPWRVAFYIHISGSMIALATGPFQFIDYFRNKYRALHQNIGKVYVFSILCMGAPTGLYMSFFANGGFWATLGFLMLSWLWMGCTYMAFQSIRERIIVAHQLWMIRSFALTFSAVTLRLWVPIFSLYTSLDHNLIIVLFSWFNWIPNLLVGEAIFYLFLKKK